MHKNYYLKYYYVSKSFNVHITTGLPECAFVALIKEFADFNRLN